MKKENFDALRRDPKFLADCDKASEKFFKLSDEETIETVIDAVNKTMKIFVLKGFPPECMMVVINMVCEIIKDSDESEKSQREDRDNT